MASTDYPLSVSSKFIDDAGTEHLVTVRGRNLEDFRGRLGEAGNIFPYAGFAHTPTVGQAIDAELAEQQTPGQPTPTPINPVAATEAQATAGAQDRATRTRIAQQDATPKCAKHQRAMLASKNGSGGYYCPSKDGDVYCQSVA